MMNIDQEVLNVWNIRHAGKVDLFNIVRPLSDGGENHGGSFIAFSADNCRQIDLTRVESAQQLVTRVGADRCYVADNWFTSTRGPMSETDAADTSLAVNKADEDLVRALKDARADVRRWSTVAVILVVVTAIQTLIFL